MPELNEEMKQTAEYAIKSARDRFKKELDFSEQSIIVLDNILTKIYWGFSGRTDNVGEGGLVFNTAMIWGSYLGEYMIFKWGGKWILKGADRLISINNIEFSPIKLVYEKITDHPELSVEDYINETKRIIYTSVINPQNAQHISKKTEQLKEQIPVKPTKKPVTINKRSIYIIAGFLGALAIIAVGIMGYVVIQTGGLPAFGLPEEITATDTTTPTQEVLLTATQEYTATPLPSATQLPTHTPTETPLPSLTPSLTYSQVPSLTPTGTLTPFIPTNTLLPTRSPTSTSARPTSTRKPPTYTPVPPSNTPVHPTNTSAPPTNTSAPPTNTPVPPTSTPVPVVVVSCQVNPSIVPAGNNVTITFSVRFSAAGYGFTAVNPHDYPGQGGCSANDGDDGSNDGVASCNGSSGLLPSSTIANILIKTSVGDCTVSYRTQ
ncbi:MAG: hypothetical protein WAV05_16825 [Anaerolineales bacterium]